MPPRTVVGQNRVFAGRLRTLKGSALRRLTRAPELRRKRIDAALLGRTQGRRRGIRNGGFESREGIDLGTPVWAGASVIPLIHPGASTGIDPRITGVLSASSSLLSYEISHSRLQIRETWLAAVLNRGKKVVNEYFTCSPYWEGCKLACPLGAVVKRCKFSMRK